jgi:hypothetical protein
VDDWKWMVQENILDQNGNLAWTREKYLQTWKNHYERLLATEEKTDSC